VQISEILAIDFCLFLKKLWINFQELCPQRKIIAEILELTEEGDSGRGRRKLLPRSRFLLEIVIAPVSVAFSFLSPRKDYVFSNRINQNCAQ